MFRKINLDLQTFIFFILEKFIPEVFDTENIEEENSKEEATVDESAEELINGEGINIVMEEENPHNMDEISEVEETDSGEFGENNIEKQEYEMDSAEYVDKPEDFGELEQEDVPESENQNTAAEKTANQSDMEEPGKDTEEILSIHDNLGLDDLPNIDNIGDSFTSTNNYNESSDISSNKNYNMLGENNDPETAAKAIKTWLNKDKKG